MRAILSVTATCLLLAGAAPALAQQSANPAAAYCDDLNQAVQAKVTHSMQSRMPSSTPGEFMNDIFKVGDIISTPIEFGIPSASSLLSQLFQFALNTVSDGRAALLREINQALSSLTQGTNINLQLPAGTFATSTPTTSQTATISPPIIGTPTFQSQPSQASGQTSSGGWIDFFRNLF